MGIPPEDRFDEGGEKVPECILMRKPDRVASLWRERFNPEYHYKERIVGRLVRNRSASYLRVRDWWSLMAEILITGLWYE